MIVKSVIAVAVSAL